VVRAAAVNLALQVLIIVTGGVVRLTASGLGCPTWPECTAGSLTPTADQVEGVGKLIEFGNRLLTFAVGLGAIAVLAAVMRWRRSLWPLAVPPLVGTAGQAVLGGITVLTSLHPATVAGHFLLSTVLVAVSTWLLVRVREPGGPVTSRLPAGLRATAWVLAGLGAVVLVLGTVVTGSGPHSGDADEPARFALDLVTVSRVHAAAVWVFAAVLAGYLVALYRGPVRGPTGERVRRWAAATAALVVVQGAVGYAQYALGLPRPLVAVHMLLAALFAAALAAVVLSTRTRGGTAPGQGTMARVPVSEATDGSDGGGSAAR
jgi:cytochrome c oxidase assembly protein subunit 15